LLNWAGVAAGFPLACHAGYAMLLNDRLMVEIHRMCNLVAIVL